MNFHVLTLFPDMILQGTGTSVTGRAVRNGVIGLEAVNIRDFSEDRHRRVDDYTYGGGAGMLMQPQPVFDAWSHVYSKISKDRHVRTIYVTPQGTPFSQSMAEELAQEDELIFLCGHYEGIDERVLEETVTDYVSIGDYVLTGGELAAMVMIDAIARLVPGVLHNDVSADTESFHGNLLEYPQYTRPEEWHGKSVPSQLLSGDPKDAARWRMEKSIERTKERRPDLFLRYQAASCCRNMLMTEKISNMDMISSIDQGHYEIISDQDGFLLKNPLTGTFYFSDFIKEPGSMEHKEGEKNHPVGGTEKIIRKVRKFAGTSAEGHDLYYRTKSLSPLLIGSDIMQEKVEEFRLLVLTRREKLPVTGLYRPDGRPTGNGVLIREVDPDTEDMPAIRKLFQCAGASREQTMELIRRGKAVCLYRNGIPEGVAAESPEGFAYRIYSACKDGVGDENAELSRRALLTWISNHLLEQGKVPYLYLDPAEKELYGIALKAGYYEAKVPVYRIVL